MTRPRHPTSAARAGMAPHIAIIGAGWAGLAAGVALSRRGLAVTVFEASRSLGGRARRVRLDGQELDNGQHILIGAYEQSLGLMREVGVDTAQALLRLPLELRYADGFCLRAARLPAPLHLAAALLRAAGLTWRERAQVVRFMLHVRNLRNGSNAVNDGKDHDPLSADNTVHALLTRHGQGATACRYLWHPLCISALNTPPELASAAAFIAVLRDSLLGKRAWSDLLIPRVDLGHLFPEPACRYIEQHGGSVRLGAPVRRIALREGRFHLDAAPSSYSHVIVATGPQHAAALLEDECFASEQRMLGALRYQPIVTCYLRYPEHTVLPHPMLGFSSGALQWLFDRGQLGGPPGLMAAVISAEGNHRQMDPAELTRQLQQEIAPLLSAPSRPAAPAQASWSRVIVEKRATFSCEAGLQRPGPGTGAPNLFLAGDYVDSAYPGTLESAVRSALHVAARITV